MSQDYSGCLSEQAESAQPGGIEAPDKVGPNSYTPRPVLLTYSRLIHQKPCLFGHLILRKEDPESKTGSWTLEKNVFSSVKRQLNF